MEFTGWTWAGVKLTIGGQKEQQWDYRETVREANVDGRPGGEMKVDHLPAQDGVP